MNRRISDEWLLAVGFKWSQEARQPNKHYKLICLTEQTRSMGLEQTTIEVQRDGWLNRDGKHIGDSESWMLWITDRFQCRAFVGDILWQEDIIALAEIITRRTWTPKNHVYGQAWPALSRPTPEPRE